MRLSSQAEELKRVEAGGLNTKVCRFVAPMQAESLNDKGIGLSTAMF
jgi:hypothetical protein